MVKEIKYCYYFMSIDKLCLKFYCSAKKKLRNFKDMYVHTYETKICFQKLSSNNPEYIQSFQSDIKAKIHS